MSASATTNQCRLLIFEGIMGSGKSTATRRFSETLIAAGLQVATYTEAADPHPVRASDDLPDFFRPWMHIDTAELGARVLEKWARFVADRLQDDFVTVMDGQLFHGDLTNLFMMEMPGSEISEHMLVLMQILAPLRPMVVYFRQRDLRNAVRSVFEMRGSDWKDYQLGWKLRSPYAMRRRLAGLEGFTSMYRDYRGLTDSLFKLLDCPKLAIETDGGDWVVYYKEIGEALHGLGVSAEQRGSDSN